MEIRTTTASEALPLLARAVMDGDELGSRGGRVMELLYPHIVLTDPSRRAVLTPGRNASLPAQIAETMWVLSGRNDVEWLSHYLPRAKDFSDDGKVWRGGYGPRLRSWGGIDQLACAVELLRADRSTRRAIISLYDPVVDVMDGKDIPCNTTLHFLSRLGKLHLHIFTRSNDLIWGWSGINAFEWSALQEVVAGLLGIEVGELHFSISSLHVYDRHWDKAERLTAARPTLPLAGSPRFRMTFPNLVDFDALAQHWFQLEEQIRTGEGDPHTHERVDTFPEPMMRSWLRVIEWWWSGDDMFLEPLAGTELAMAARLSPQSTRPIHAVLTDQDWDEVAKARFPWEDPELDPRPVDPFVEFVEKLHAEKHTVYGDSWKRRGEQVGILANIARKVDRLGEAGAGDTSADTAIDLLVYLAKYRLWLADGGEDVPAGFTGWGRPLGDGPISVNHLLRSLYLSDTSDVKALIVYEKEAFELLSKAVENNGRRMRIVDLMIQHAFPLARLLWLGEQPMSEGQRIDAWKAGNAKRSWNPDA